MAEVKTKPTGEDVRQFLNAIEDAGKRQDCLSLLEMMRQATQMEPKLWASSMVGFGEYHYKYASGREGDSFQVGFAPRKGDLSLYGLQSGFEQQEELLARLGKYKAGKGCIYLKRLADVDQAALSEMIARSYEHKVMAHE